MCWFGTVASDPQNHGFLLRQVSRQPTAALSPCCHAPNPGLDTCTKPPTPAPKCGDSSSVVPRGDEDVKDSLGEVLPRRTPDFTMTVYRNGLRAGCQSGHAAGACKPDAEVLGVRPTSSCCCAAPRGPAPSVLPIRKRGGKEAPGATI